MKTKCYSVRLKCLTSISDKCYLATAFNGSEALIPKSMVFGQDYSVTKSDAYWISAWILEKRSLQYSDKKSAAFDSVTRKMVPDVRIERIIPPTIDPITPTVDESLTR